MRILKEKIIPFEGLESFKFGDRIESIRHILKKQQISFDQCMGEKQYIRPDLKHETISIDRSVMLYFVDGILFEIGLENNFIGCLPNETCIGMDMDKAKENDSDLKYDDDDEAYFSSKGYSIVDDIETNKVSYIEIYIPEVVDSEKFFQYEWINRFN